MKDEMKKCGCVKNHDDKKKDWWCKDDDDMKRDCWRKDCDDMKRDCWRKDDDDRKKDCWRKDDDDKKKDCWHKDDDDKKKCCCCKDDDKKKCCCCKDDDDRKKCCCCKDDDKKKCCCCKDDDKKKCCCCKDDDRKKDCCCKDDDMKKDCCCISSSVCNFKPVCCNGICPVPRMPHKVDVVVGAGVFENEAEPEEPEEPVDPVEPEEPDPEKANVEFKIHIFKEFSKYKGELLIADHENGILIHSEKLECFHSDFRTKMVAIFHVPEGPTTGSYELTVYASPAYCTIPAKFHAFSAPICGEGIFIGGDVSVGEITIFKDKKGH